MTHFNFIYPLWFLGLIPSLILYALILKQSPYPHPSPEFCDKALVPHLIYSPHPNNIRAYRTHALGLAWLLTLLALAGPSWHQLPQALYQSKGTTLFLLDLSPQMNESSPPPSRLIRARYKLADLIQTQQDGEMALIVFSAEPYLAVPLTHDANMITSLLPALEPSIMPVAGTNTQDALLFAQHYLQEQGDPQASIVLITTHSVDKNTLARAKQFAKAGVSIHVLDMNSTETPSLKSLAQLSGGHYALFRSDHRDIASLKEAEISDHAGQYTGNNRFMRINEGGWLIWPILGLVAFVWRPLWLRRKIR